MGVGLGLCTGNSTNAHAKYLLVRKVAETDLLVSGDKSDTAEVPRVYDNMLQRAQKCIDVQGDHFQHLL
jgi:hypothetical protein